MEFVAHLNLFLWIAACLVNCNDRNKKDNIGFCRLWRREGNRIQRDVIVTFPLPPTGSTPPLVPNVSGAVLWKSLQIGINQETIKFKCILYVDLYGISRLLSLKNELRKSNWLSEVLPTRQRQTPYKCFPMKEDFLWDQIGVSVWLIIRLLILEKKCHDFYDVNVHPEFRP